MKILALGKNAWAATEPIWSISYDLSAPAKKSMQLIEIEK